MADSTLLKALEERILILDGAMGTVLQRHHLTEEDFRGDIFRSSEKELKGDNECLNLTRPELIRSIHQAYIDAGADIIETNSFNANRIQQKAFGLEESARRMAYESARTARSAADNAGRKVWVAGSVGPTGRSLSLASDINRPEWREYDFDAMADAYAEQIGALAEGGADLILIETCFDALNTKAAIYALQKAAPELPVIISAAVSDRSGRTLTGQTLDAFYTSVKHAPLLAFGLNCSFGAADLRHLVDELSPAVECAFSFYPNAGLPNELGQYDETPEMMAESIRSMAGDGLLNIVGGCCGTGPEHIAAIAEAVKGLAPRRLPEREAEIRPRLTVSGLERVTIDKDINIFTNIGERTNVAGSRKFARLIASGAYEEALQVAAGQIEGGASVIDINFDDAMLDSEREMTVFLRHISNDPAVAGAALMIDSSHFGTIMAGLKNAQGKCIVNSISLKEGEQAFIDKARAIKALGAAMVVMAFDEEGQATTYNRKIEICRRAYDLLTRQAGVAPSDIIFDVNVLSIGTGIAEHSRYGVDFIDAVRWIKQNLPGSLTSGGISNLSFAFRGNNAVREAMHSAFLYHAIGAGLDMGIVNPSMLKVYDDVEPEMLRCVEDVIFDRDAEATERLISKAREVAESAVQADGAQAAADAGVADLSLEERLCDAVVKGRGEHLASDLEEAVQRYDKAVEVIEGPLMAGMEKVGKLFGDGKMFLPQVVKSAKIMRDAVELLQPHMGAQGGEEREGRPVFVIATVKGDVHDIGKNITGIVLGCNGFKVEDLGVMVPCETIVDEAQRLGAAIVGASGLITPSLSRMEELCRLMAARGMSTPLFVGGATTSALHTAVKLAPLYGHVYHSADASTSAVMAKRYMMDPAGFEEAGHKEQERLRELYSKGISAAAGDTVKFDRSAYVCGKVFSDIPADEVPVDELVGLIDWKMFLAVWGLKKDAYDSDEAAALKKDALELLEKYRGGHGCKVMLAARFDECCSDGDDICLGDGTVIPMLRQQEAQGLSLADFVIGRESGLRSAMGMFAVSVLSEGHGAGCGCGHCEAEYESMMARSVRLCLAEAASCWLDGRLRSELPEEFAGFRICKPAIGYSCCPDHSLKRLILPMLPESERLGISLTESCAMVPDASICGLVFVHREASYPEIHKLQAEVVDEYAARRQMSEEEKSLFLGHLVV